MMRSSWAEFARTCLAAQDERIIKDGATLQSPADNLAELKLQAATFERERLPILQAAMIA
jgi:hypothetical protein